MEMVSFLIKRAVYTVAYIQTVSAHHLFIQSDDLIYNDVYMSSLTFLLFV